LSRESIQATESFNAEDAKDFAEERREYGFRVLMQFEAGSSEFSLQAVAYAMQAKA